MGKKREILIAAISLLLLVLIIAVMMIILYLALLGVDKLGLNVLVFSVGVEYVFLGLSIGISLSFGFVIAKRLFDSLFPKTSIE